MTHHTASSQLDRAADDVAQVSTIFVRALIEVVEATGIPAELFVSKAAIAPEQFETPYGWVDSDEFDRWLGCAVALSGDPAFGLHWTTRSPMMKFDVLAMAIAYAPTLRDALLCLQRFQSILYQHPEVRVEEREDVVRLRVVPLATTELALRVRTEVGVFGLVRLLRHVGAPSTALRRVSFTHDAPAYAEEYPRELGAPAHFAEENSGIAIDRVWLDRRVQHTNAQLYQKLTEQAEEVLLRIQTSTRYADQVRDYVRLAFPRAPEMRELCRALALSERSLRRRLAEEGVSYSTILEDTRKGLAQQLIADSTRSIAEVGRDVGFTSGAAFHRAFKRWTGETPREFRDTKARPAALRRKRA